jgi:phosphoglycerate dehydrogenase-like enzyme
MSNLHILCDLPFSGAALQLLKDGTSPHQLSFSYRAPGSSIYAPMVDPAMDGADIAFGHPGAGSVLASKQVKWLAVASAGFTPYDTPEFRKTAADRGLIVTNASHVFANACAEHLLSFMLAQSRALLPALGNRGDKAEVSQIKEKATCLRGEEVLILGFGHIGMRLIELLVPVQMKVTGMRRRPKGDEPISMVSLEELPGALAKADPVVNVLPDNAESAHFISTERLAQMKPGAAFYNIGRGATVDQEALMAALNSGHLGAAWLDVTVPEPVPADHPLRTTPRCFITPHMAGSHRTFMDGLARHFLQNLRLFIEGQPLLDRVM